jgi:hypothetical protein
MKSPAHYKLVIHSTMKAPPHFRTEIKKILLKHRPNSNQSKQS